MPKPTLLAALLLTALARPAAAIPPAEPESHAGTRSAGPGWTYWRLGNPADVQTKTEGGIGFEGGGTDVNELYRWLCRKAGHGDILVLSAYGAPAYNPYIHRLCPEANSVATLRINKRIGAFQPFVAQTIANAEGVFLTGGNQANYIRRWRNSPVQAALNDLHRRHAPIAGTSAGNAVLGRYAYSALENTIDSRNALHNCFNRHITIDTDFLHTSKLTRDLITDDHFVTRDRMGRLVTFLARIALDGHTPLPVAVASNENTAYLMEPNGVGYVVGSSDVYFLRTTAAPEVCADKTPVTNTGIEVYRLGQGHVFDLRHWQGTGGTSYNISATEGQLTTTGNNGKIY